MSAAAVATRKGGRGEESGVTYIDTDVAAQKVNDMWLRLARRIDRKLPAILEKCGPRYAVDYARFAEACYWQATGDCDTNDVKDVLKS